MGKSKTFGDTSNKKKKGGTSSTKKDEVVFPRDSPELIHKFAKLQDRDHYSTRWYDKNEMEAIDLHSSLARLCRRIGARSLLNFDTPSYRALTCEFLATLSVDVSHVVVGEIYFWLRERGSFP